MVKKAPFAALLFLFLVISTGCDESAGCDDCDEGYQFDYVTTGNIQELTTIVGIEIGDCFRYIQDGTEYDLDHVAVVNDCCCEIQGY